jgi:hypothetical protein
MSLAITSAGSKLWIGNPPVAQTLTDLQNVSYTEVKEVTDIGEFGRTYNLVTHNPLGDRITVKRKGSINNGTLQVQMAYAPADPGQTLLATAVDSDSSYSYKVTLQDNTNFYFTGQAMGRPVQVGGVDSFTASTCNIEIDSQIFRV